MSNEPNTRFYGMLGFARRAGKVVIGTELVCRAMPKRADGKIWLVIISDKVSDATRKKLTVKSDFYGIDYIEVNMGMEELAHILGKNSAVAAVAVTDERFSREIKNALSV